MFAILAAPQKVWWSAECQAAFQKIKEILCSQLVLQTPDFERPFIFQTDASDITIGEVLSKKYDKEEHLVLYFNHKLLVHGRACAIIEKVCLMVKEAIETLLFSTMQPLSISRPHSTEEAELYEGHECKSYEVVSDPAALLLFGGVSLQSLEEECRFLLPGKGEQRFHRECSCLIPKRGGVRDQPS